MPILKQVGSAVNWLVLFHPNYIKKFDFGGYKRVIARTLGQLVLFVVHLFGECLRKKTTCSARSSVVDRIKD